jgi:hypothetical protein
VMGATWSVMVTSDVSVGLVGRSADWRQGRQGL